MFLFSVLVSVIFTVAPHELEARSYIPSGEVLAKRMDLAYSDRAVELATRLQAAVAKNDEWWIDYVKNAVPGEPLPYDERMGLTEEEYREYLALASAPVLRQVGSVGLRFEWDGDSSVLVTATDPDLGVGELRIDLTRERVETAYGVLADRSEINNDAEDSPTGPWVGVQWSLEEGDDELQHAVSASLSLGRLERTGEGILYFNAKQVRDRQLVRKASVVLVYSIEP